MEGLGHVLGHGHNLRGRSRPACSDHAPAGCYLWAKAARSGFGRVNFERCFYLMPDDAAALLTMIEGP